MFVATNTKLVDSPPNNVYLSQKPIQIEIGWLIWRDFTMSTVIPSDFHM